MRLGLNITSRVVPEPDLLHPVGFAAKMKKKKNNQMLQSLHAYKGSLTAVKVWGQQISERWVYSRPAWESLPGALTAGNEHLLALQGGACARSSQPAPPGLTSSSGYTGDGIAGGSGITHFAKPCAPKPGCKAVSTTRASFRRYLQ